MDDAPSAESDAPRCAVVCITTDERGKGYWCPTCPEARPGDRVIPPGQDR